MRDSLHTLESGLEDRVRLGLDPSRGRGVRRTAVRWIVFDAAVTWWIVRGCQHNPVCKARFAAVIVAQNRMRDDRGWGVLVAFGNPDLDAIRCKYLEHGRIGRT